MRHTFAFLLAPALVAFAPACDPTPETQSEMRGEWTPAGKADGSASCGGLCGDQAPGGCWCDETCADYGDCCPDYGPVCEGTAPAPTDSATLVSDEYIIRSHGGFQPLYRGHDAWVPYAVNVHPGNGLVLGVEVRHYRWNQAQGLVDLGSEPLERHPSSIGLSSAGSLLSHSHNNLFRSAGHSDEIDIPNMWNSSTGAYHGRGTILADEHDARWLVSVNNPVARTQVIDTRAFSGWQAAGVLLGHAADVDREHVLTLTSSEARVYSVGDAYSPEQLSRTSILQSSGGVLRDGLVYVMTGADELSTIDAEGGDVLRRTETNSGPGFLKLLYDQGDLLFMASGRTISVLDLSTPTDPVVVDVITLEPSTEIQRIDALSGAGDILHIWGRDTNSDRIGHNSRMRLRTIRLPQYN